MRNRKMKKLAILLVISFLMTLLPLQARWVVSKGKFTTGLDIKTNIGSSVGRKKTVNLKPWEVNVKKSSDDQKKKVEIKRDTSIKKKDEKIKPNAKLKVAGIDIIKYEKSAKNINEKNLVNKKYTSKDGKVKANAKIDTSWWGIRSKVSGSLGGDVEVGVGEDGIKRSSFVGAKVGVQADLVLAEIKGRASTSYTDSRGITYGLAGNGYVQAGSFNKADLKAGLDNGQMIVQGDVDSFTGVRTGGEVSASIAKNGVKGTVTGYGKVGVGLGLHGRFKLKISWSGISWDTSFGAYLGVGGETGIRGNIDWGKTLDPIKAKASKVIAATTQKAKQMAATTKKRLANLKNQVTTSLNNTKQQVKQLASNVKKNVVQIKQGLSNAANGIKQKFSQTAKNVKQTVASTIKGIRKGGIKNIKNIAGNVKSAASQIRRNITSSVKGAKQQAKQVVTQVASNVRKNVGGVVNKVKTKVNRIKRRGIKIARSFQNKIKSFSGGIFSSIKRWF